MAHDDPPIDEEVVRDMTADPFYAIEFAPVYGEPHDPIVDIDTWIAANKHAIEEDGAEEWLRRLLRILTGDGRHMTPGERVLDRDSAASADAADEIFELDFGEIGFRLVMLVLASVQLGHRRPASTLDYVHPTLPEARFVRDVLQGESNDDLCEAWFGGRKNALRMLNAIEKGK